MPSRFVIPSTTLLTLANGDTLTVWTRLNAGQQQRRMARMYVMAPNGDQTIDLLMIGRATILAFLVDWHLADDDVPIKGLSPDDLNAILDNLEPEDLAEIRRAIDAHETAQAATRAAEKKTIPNGKIGSDATLTLHAGVAGAMSG